MPATNQVTQFDFYKNCRIFILSFFQYIECNYANQHWGATTTVKKLRINIRVNIHNNNRKTHPIVIMPKYNPEWINTNNICGKNNNHHSTAEK